MSLQSQGWKETDLLGLRDLFEKLHYDLQRHDEHQKTEDTEHHLLEGPRRVLLFLESGRETDVVFGNGVQA